MVLCLIQWCVVPARTPATVDHHAQLVLSELTSHITDAWVVSRVAAALRRTRSGRQASGTVKSQVYHVIISTWFDNHHRHHHLFPQSIVVRLEHHKHVNDRRFFKWKNTWLISLWLATDEAAKLVGLYSRHESTAYFRVFRWAPGRATKIRNYNFPDIIWLMYRLNLGLLKTAVVSLSLLLLLASATCITVAFVWKLCLQPRLLSQ